MLFFPPNNEPLELLICHRQSPKLGLTSKFFKTIKHKFLKSQVIIAKSKITNEHVQHEDTGVPRIIPSKNF